MTDTPSSILLTREQSTGSNTNTWGGYLIVTERMMEQAAKGYQALAVTGDATISWTNYTAGNSGSCAFLKLTGTLSAAATLTFPSYQNDLVVYNTAGATVTIKCSGGTGVAIPTSRRTRISCDGTDYTYTTPDWSPSATTLTNNGDLATYSQIQTLIANAALPASTGAILNSAADTTAGYLSQKVTASIGGVSTTQLAGLTSFQLSTDTPAGNERLKLTLGAPYVGGFLNGGTQAAEFTPSIGYAYDVDCTAATTTVNLGGISSPQVGQEVKLNNFGNFPMYLKGTVNGVSNMTIPTAQNQHYRYCGSSWGWN